VKTGKTGVVAAANAKMPTVLVGEPEEYRVKGLHIRDHFITVRLDAACLNSAQRTRRARARGLTATTTNAGARVSRRERQFP
jgi:hypothetical protein